MLKEQTKVFGAPEMFVLHNFEYFDGWLAKFKQRFHLKCYTVSGESAEVIDEKLVEQERLKLQEITKDYSPDDVYNADESALFYRLQPNKTLASSALNGIIESKERLTVMFAVNATGFHK